MAKECPKEYGYLKNGKCIQHKKAKKPEKPSLLKSAKSVIRPLKGDKTRRTAEAVARTLAGTLTWGGSEALLTLDKFAKERKAQSKEQTRLASQKRMRKSPRKRKKEIPGGRKYAAKSKKK